jgi:hypothetical protein
MFRVMAVDLFALVPTDGLFPAQDEAGEVGRMVGDPDAIHVAERHPPQWPYLRSSLKQSGDVIEHRQHARSKA